MKKNIKLILLVVYILFCLTPSVTNATSVYLESSQKNIKEGDTTVIDVKINSDKNFINAVEGSVVIDTASGVSVSELSLAGSVLSLWPKSPAISSDGKTISFVGGVPGGFNSDGATLFKIVLEAKKKGQVTISPKNITAYINDGKGTKTQVVTTNIVLDIYSRDNTPVKNEWEKIMSSDAIPPEDFIITIGQDNTLFDGKKFAFFNAIDKQTGIDYYEVYEAGNNVVRSGNMYVLQKQDVGTPELKVIAYDKSGNTKVSVYKQEQEQESKDRAKSFGFFGGAIVIFLLVLVLILKLVGRRRG